MGSEKKEKSFWEKTGLWNSDAAKEDEREERVPKAQPFKSKFDKEEPSGSSHTPSFQSTAPIIGQRKQEVVDFLYKVRTDNNIQGPDYHEFSIALDDYKADIADEAQRVKLAFKSFKSMGVTPQKLVETANHYKKLYAEKRAAFDATIDKEIKNAVGTRKADVDSLNSRNASIDAEIEKLQKEKSTNEARIVTLNDEINSNSSRLNERKLDFQVTYDDVVGEIDRNLNLIQQHL